MVYKHSETVLILTTYQPYLVPATCLAERPYPIDDLAPIRHFGKLYTNMGSEFGQFCSIIHFLGGKKCSHSNNYCS